MQVEEWTQFLNISFIKFWYYFCVIWMHSDYSLSILASMLMWANTRNVMNSFACSIPYKINNRHCTQSVPAHGTINFKFWPVVLHTLVVWLYVFLSDGINVSYKFCLALLKVWGLTSSGVIGWATVSAVWGDAPYTRFLLRPLKLRE